LNRTIKLEHFAIGRQTDRQISDITEADMSVFCVL